jgi:hypothetical protein
MDDRSTRKTDLAAGGSVGGKGMAVAVRGAVIVREYEGAYTNTVVYKRRCDTCGYVSPGGPITVSCLPYDTRMHGCYHTESFVCSFCGNRQVVEIQG